MPKIIRHALYRKLCNLPEMREFQSDFELMTGMKLAFLDDLGLGDDLEHGVSPLCAAIQSSEEGRALCARSRHALLAGDGDAPGCMTCDAGLMELMVPINIAGIRAGYLVFGGIRTSPAKSSTLSKAAHLLRKNGIAFEEDRLRQCFEGTREVPTQNLEAFQRLIQLFVRQIALKITDQLGTPDASMPPMVNKACKFIRANAMLENISLEEVARHCGVSSGHLSRMFHHSTGLTFREYLAQVRVEHARGLIVRTNRSVTEIAYESGFQTLSQFHRVFLKAFGVPPGKLRASKREVRTRRKKNQ
jgi:AraC-like DNA-binding protein/ligand-binding sensor protein